MVSSLGWTPRHEVLEVDTSGVATSSASSELDSAPADPGVTRRPSWRGDATGGLALGGDRWRRNGTSCEVVQHVVSVGGAFRVRARFDEGDIHAQRMTIVARLRRRRAPVALL
jgi:hypothetical protein